MDLQKEADILTDGLVEHLLGRNPRHEILDHIKLACESCKLCPLGWKIAKKNDEERDPHVFSNMNMSRYVVVGQNPGWNELEAKEPFVGASGKTFNQALADNGHSRDEFYVTNICKCHTEGNAKPSPEYISACESYLRLEFLALKPRIVVALGAPALELLCPGSRLSESLGTIIKSEKFGVKVFSVYHPSPMNLAVVERKEAFHRQIKVLCKLIDHLNTTSIL